MTTFLARIGKINSHVLAYATVLVAFFLRVDRLADKNIWWDEGWSVWLSQKDPAWIALRTAADEHPPLHYWILHFWNMVAGTDAFAGRFISLAFGVLTIALIYRIGKRVGGMGIGTLAALFLATARFHIWWSQDIKNYTLSIFFAFAAIWFALDLLSDSSGRTPPSTMRHSQLGYALCAALALWTHYLAALVLLALNLYALIVILSEAKDLRKSNEAPRPAQRERKTRRTGTLVNWVIANLLAAALFAPWMYLYLQNAAAWSAAPVFDFSLFLKLVATVLPLGVTTDIDNYAVLTAALTLIAAVPVFSLLYSVISKRKAENRGSSLNTEYRLLFALIIALPPILLYALSLTPISFFAPKIQARYLLVLLPAYMLLLALGIDTLKRFSTWLALAGTVFILAASAFVLSDYYADRRLTDDYATLANTINSFARQGDVVLLDTDQEWPTFLYYLRVPVDSPTGKGISWLGVPNGQTMDAGSADTLAQRTLRLGGAVWLVAIPDALATDPQDLYESRLARDLPKQFEKTYGDKRLVLYSSMPRDMVEVASKNFAPEHVRADTIDDNRQLVGFDLPVRQAYAGDTLRLVTYWNARNAAVAQINSQAVPVPAGERVRVESDIIIPPSAVGDFAIRVDTLELARVQVEPRAGISSAGTISHPTDYRLGDAIHLAGYDLPQKGFRAGENVPLTLYWSADHPLDKNYTVFVHLVGTALNPAHSPSNPLWGQVDRAPREGTYPTMAWLPNEIVPDAYNVSIDPHAPAGPYQIEVGLYDPATGVRLPVGGVDSVIVAEINIVP